MKKNYFKSSIRKVPVSLLAVLLLCWMFGVTAYGGEKPEIFVQLGHQGSVDTAAFSGDGKYVATGCNDFSVKLWDAASGAEVRTFLGHAAKINAVAVSFDGSLVASGDESGAIKLWDAMTGREIRTMVITGRHPAIRFLSFSPDARSVSSVDMNLGTLTLWDVSTGRPLKTVDRVNGYPDIPPGESYLMVETSYQKYSLVDVSSGTEAAAFGINELRRGDGGSFSQDGHYGLFMKSNYGSKPLVLDIFDTEAKKVVAVPWDMGNDKAGDFNKVALSPDGRYAVVAGDKGIKMWDTVSGKVVRSFTSSRTYCIAFSPDGRFILSTGYYTPTLWEVSTGKIVRSYGSRPLSHVSSVALSPGGNHFMANSKNAPPFLWGVNSGKAVKILNDYALLRGFYADGRYIFLESKNKTSELRDINTDRQIKAFPTAYVTVSSNGRYAAESISERNIKVTELATGKEILNYTDRSGAIASFSLTGNNGYLLVKVENTAKRINLETGAEEIVIWPKHDGHYDYDYSPDGKFIALTLWHDLHKNRTLKVYDIEAGKEVASHESHASLYGTSCDFSPDGRQILFGLNKQLILADTATGAVLRTYSGPAGGDYRFSAQGDRIVSVASDKNIRVWDTASGKLLMTFVGHESSVRTASISFDGRHVLSVGGDNTIRLWDFATGKEQAKFLSFTDGEWIVITPEGYFNASPNGAKNINVRIGNKVYGIDQFYTKFYRPELVQLAIAGKELPKGETLGDIMANKPAPAIRVLSPASGSTIDKDHTTLSVRVSDNGGGVGNIMIYLNGSQVANETRGVIVKGKAARNENTLSFTIPLVEGKNEIRVVAFNKENSMESNPASVSVISKAVMQKPNLYALVIGINEYRNKSISLNYAVKDAKAFAETLKKMAAPLFEKMFVQVHTAPAATTRGAITKAFESLRMQIRPNDLFVFYNASHGVVDVVDNEEQFFLLTSNVLLLSSRHINRDAMGQKELAKLIGNIPAQKKVVILDTCNAGKGGREIQVALLQQTRGLTDSTAVKLLQRAIGSAVFSASSDSQLALEGYKGHGLFTYVLLEGLKGKADVKKDGYITILNLADYVEENVTRLSEEVFNRQQTPTIQTGANFPIGKMR